MRDAHRRAERAPGDRAVGRVAALWRYPVKSMGGEALDEVEVGWHGVAGDRRWAFIRDTAAGNGFPWLTIRQCPDMARYRAWFAEPDRVETSPTMVCSPDGTDFDVVDPALAARLGDRLRVIRQHRGVFDTLPLSLITTQSIAGVERLAGGGLDVRRFRPNVVIEAADEDAFPEDGWVGHVLRVGGLRVRADARDRRCAVVDVDPATARRDPAVLRAITRHRQACLGIYGSTVEPGRVAVGDPVRIET